MIEWMTNYSWQNSDQNNEENTDNIPQRGWKGMNDGIDDRISVYEWKYVIKNAHLIDKTLPFVIKDTPSNKWQLSNISNLMENIGFIFEDYKDASFQVQTSDCSCFEDNIDLCKEYVKGHTYSSRRNQKQFGQRKNSFWHKHEINHDDHSKYNDCIYSTKHGDNVVNIIRNIQILNVINSLSSNSMRQNISSLTFNFKIMEQNEYDKKLYIDSLSLKFFNLIALGPIFNLFGMKKEYRDLSAIHVWFGTNDYRTILHFDYNDNMFFMLNGYKTFYLSPPSLDNFNLFPFLHESERQTIPIYLNQNQYKNRNEGDSNIYKVTVHCGDLLYIPSFWYHEVINGNQDDMSFGFNIWAMDRQLKHDLLNKIEHFSFPLLMRKLLKQGIKRKNFNQIVYFIGELQTQFCHQISENIDECKSKTFMMSYFGKIYPILTEIQNYHLSLGDNVNIRNNLKWLDWFINFRDLLKCNDINYKDKRFKLLRKLFYQRSYTLICKDIKDTFHDVIDEIMSLLLSAKRLKDEQVAKILLVQLIEDVLFTTINDTQFMPLVVTLYFL